MPFSKSEHGIGGLTERLWVRGRRNHTLNDFMHMFIGLDAHKDYFQAAVLDTQGQLVKQRYARFRIAMIAILRIGTAALIASGQEANTSPKG